MNSSFFQKAIPVWKKNKEKELHSRCAFFATFTKVKNAVLVITCCNAYKVYLNGRFLGAGPARSAHGYFRVDKLPLNNLREKNTLFIEAVAYNTRGYCYLDQPGFLQAEILSDGFAVAWTGKHFLVRNYDERLQKVSKFSYQRPFTEVYAFFRNPISTYSDFSANGSQVEPEFPVPVQSGVYQERHVSYPRYNVYPSTLIETGNFHVGNKIPKQSPWLLFESLKIFKKEDWESHWGNELQRMEYEKKPINKGIGAGEYSLYDLGHTQTGFIRLKFTAIEDSLVLVFFSEIDLNTDENKPADIRCDHAGCVNVLEYRVKGGEEYEHSSFEPYSAKYIKVLVIRGKIDGVNVSLMSYENPDTESFTFTCEDKRLEEIMESARRTFKQNALDILTDCPSRERAGWLCDSYFSAEAESLFTGENKVEYNFLENYIYTPQLGLPDGMLPMCYPAEVIEPRYIPNWALFYIVEIYNGYIRTGDFTLAQRSRQKIEGALKFFEKYVNEDGLLENLESWVFVEWSKANDKTFVCGVNYPSNMLYAKALEATGKMYDVKEYVSRAEKIKENIRKDSFNGMFFEDNRVRAEGELQATGHITETCQYYAFFTGVATPELYPTLFRRLVEEFGFERQEEKTYPQVYKSNAFIGNYLRLMMLADNGEEARLSKECVGYFYNMAKRTGTLWEHDDTRASLNHGFASYVAVFLVKYMTGYKGRQGNRLYFSTPTTKMDCRLTLPLGEGVLEYVRKNGDVQMKVPDGYIVEECKI